MKPTGLKDALTKVTKPDAPIEKPPVNLRGRRDKKLIGGFFDRAASKQINQLALDHDTSVQALLGEALNDLFEKYDKPPIA